MIRLLFIYYTMKSTYPVIVIGLGHQSQEDHLPAIKELESLRLIGVVDINLDIAEKIGAQYNVPFAQTPQELLKQIETPTLAIVALPHNEYLPIIEFLAEKKIHIIKEKPFAVSLEEARALINLTKKYNVSIQVTLQRRFNPIFKSFEQLLKRIGNVHSVESRYTLNVNDLGQGWRAKKNLAGGGVLIDMGYHYIDLFIWYFGIPQKIKCRMSGGNRLNQNYDVEDTVFLDFTYEGEHKNILATLFVSRVHLEKNEGLTAYGNKGSVTVSRGRVARYDVEGNLIEELVRTGSWPSAIIDQLETLVENIDSGEWVRNINNYLEHTIVIDASYSSAVTGNEVETKEYLNVL
jgi:predicted dehydrogenase